MDQCTRRIIRFGVQAVAGEFADFAGRGDSNGAERDRTVGARQIHVQRR